MSASKYVDEINKEIDRLMGLIRIQQRLIEQANTPPPPPKDTRIDVERHVDEAWEKFK